MSKSAAEINSEINEALDKCKSLRAIGLWYKMQRTINSNANPGRYEIDGKPVTLCALTGDVGPDSSREQLETMIGLLSRLRVGDEPLLQWITVDGTEVLYSGPLARCAIQKRKVLESVKRSQAKNRGLIKPPMGLIKPFQSENIGKSEEVVDGLIKPSPPPKGFPPTTPFPIPPQIPEDCYTREETFGNSDEEIYQAYPRHVAKGAALSAIRKARTRIAQRGELDPAGFLMARVKLYASCRAGQDSEFTPHPATWLNADRFDDDENEWKPKNGKHQTQRIKPTAEQRGEFPEPENRIPEYRPRKSFVGSNEKVTAE